MIPTTDPYVPATIINVPITITNTLQTTMATHRFDLPPSLPLAQLSYSHMAPIGWMHIAGPRSAPMSETSASKTGIVDAMMYAITVMPSVHEIHVVQWISVLLVRCREPRRAWTKMNLAGI
jgi:hypothetical protein